MNSRTHKKFRITVRLFSIFVNSLFMYSLFAQTDTSSVTWNLDCLDQIGGHPVILYGNPYVITTLIGKAIYFSGSSTTNDGLLIESNPLDNVTEFTLEVLLRIDTSSSLKQKYIHIENPDNNYSQKRRVLMEYEKASDSTWFFHGYVAVGSTNCTLASISLPHYYGQWHTLALVYKDSTIKSYINGLFELTGSIPFLPIIDGHISIGRRMNNEVNSWFKGAIQTIRFTPRALLPSELLTPQTTGVAKADFDIQSFRLDQNYPNPFNPATRIAYHITKESHVTLTIFDVLGRKISTLVDEEKIAGNYSVNFNAAHLSSGVYVYYLSTDHHSSTRKMLIVK